MLMRRIPTAPGPARYLSAINTAHPIRSNPTSPGCVEMQRERADAIVVVHVRLQITVVTQG